ncbi:hypothetical protein [Rhodomicrobium lacus]|uniref:hypothetical protein n=1 Tax=Rhodomicrobium lacus TaxID=2498452 RepID=UPI0013DF2B58|nr:hypothetical protein [Rhodomicrobium lacus]
MSPRTNRFVVSFLVLSEAVSSAILERIVNYKSVLESYPSLLLPLRAYAERQRIQQ